MDASITSSTATSMFDNIKSRLTSLNNRLFKDPRISKNHQLANSINIDKYDGQNIQHILETLDFYKEAASLVVKDTMYVHGANLLTDIEFFDTTAKPTKTKAVFDHINYCSLHGSKPLSMEIYNNPIQDVVMLRARIETLKGIEKEYLHNNELVNTLLTRMQTNEKYIAWLFEEKEENLKDLYDVVFFRFKALKRLNSSSICLTTYNMYRMFFSPIFGIVSPLLYFIIPYIILIYKLKLKIPFTTYMRMIFRSVLSSDATLFGKGQIFKYIRIVSYLFSAVFYLQGVFSSVDLAKTVHKISKLLIGNLNGVIEYVASYKQLVNVLGGNKDGNILTTAFFNTPTALSKCFDNVGGLTELLKGAGEFSVLKNFGQQLKTFKTIDRDDMRAVLQHSYMVDAILGAVKYKNMNNFSYPEISDIVHKENGRPVLHIEGMVHPCIDKSKAVENTVHLGQYSQEQNLIITSPNSSGKSILIKSIIVNVVMAQTMGITSASKLCLTPFRYINTQINVPDATGHESLFEAEMHRCKHNLDMLLKLAVKGATLIVMDEIFNSTNPLEAVAGAFAVCKRMSQHPNNILIFTTHYNYLTKLAKQPDCRFANYRMETLVHGDKIDFTYKFQRGVNKHLLALELLKKSGFESSVIEEAIVIKNSLQSKVLSASKQ